jgi:hypothetical protein
MLKFQQIHSMDSIVGPSSPKFLAKIEDDKQDSSSVLSKFLRSGVAVSRVIDVPSINSSTKTLNEINYITRRMNDATEEEKKFSIEMDSVKNHYNFWAEQASVITGENYSREMISNLTNKTEGFLNYLKAYFNRARPYQISNEYGKRLTIIVGDPYTPSYPSGHTFEAWLIALTLSAKHQNHREKFESMANQIADSRVVAGVHYPSDNIAGKRVATYVVKNKLVEPLK